MLRKLVLSSLVLILVVASSSAEAQLEEMQQPDYPAECLADWDPFCPLRPAGTGYAHYMGCFTCFWIPTGPEGEGSYYECLDNGGPGDPSRCTNYTWGCDMGGLCQLA